MVPRFDQAQLQKMWFQIGFHNIYSKYKPRNHEYTNYIFKKFFLSPSWRHGPQKHLTLTVDFQINYNRLGGSTLADHFARLLKLRKRPMSVRPNIDQVPLFIDPTFPLALYFLSNTTINKCKLPCQPNIGLFLVVNSNYI